MYYAINRNQYYLEHHGILGQRWGVRRFQNKDGSYTTEGKKRHAAEDYGPTTSSNKKSERLQSKINRNKTMASMNTAAMKSSKNKIAKAIYKTNADYYNNKASKLENGKTPKEYVSKQTKKAEKSLERYNKFDAKARIRYEKKTGQKYVEDDEDRQIRAAKEARVKINKMMDKKVSDFRAQQSTGKKVAERILYGKKGSEAYDTLRAIGEKSAYNAYATEVFKGINGAARSANKIRNKVVKNELNKYDNTNSNKKTSVAKAAVDGYKNTKNVYASLNQNPNAYQRAMRKLGASNFAKEAIKTSKYLDENGKKRAMAEHQILRAERNVNRARKAYGVAKSVANRNK